MLRPVLVPAFADNVAIPSRQRAPTPTGTTGLVYRRDMPRWTWQFLALVLLATSACGAGSGDDLAVVLGQRDSSEIRIHSAGGEPQRVNFDGPAASGLLTYGQNVLLSVSAGEIRQFHLVDASTGESTVFHSSPRFPYYDQPALGSEWVSLNHYQGDDSAWTVVNLNTGETFAPNDRVPAWPPVFSGDGTKLTYVTTDFRGILVDLSDGSTKDFGPQTVPTVSLSPSGKRLASISPTFVVSLDSGEGIMLDNIAAVLGWLDDNTLIVHTSSGELARADADSGAITVVEGDGGAHRSRGGQLMVDDGLDGVLSVTDMESGELTAFDVPDNSRMHGARFTTERYVWGFIGGVNGSRDNLGGWVFDRDSDDLTTFEQPLTDGQFYAAFDNGYSADWSATIFSDNAGSLYVAQAGQELERLPTEGPTRGAFCPDGSIVVFTPDSEEPARLLSADSYDVIREFEAADWAICALAES